MKQDLTGKIFGKLNVIEYIGKSASRHSIWKCRCECGIEKNILGIHLKSGKIISCGCGRGAKKKHGHCSGRRTKTYTSWSCMIQRCTNPNHDFWEWYGGRGIEVCDRWRTFANFLEDMGERPANCSIDRIDRDGNYCKENCEWADPDEQTTNRSNSVVIFHNGKEQSLMDWADELGIQYETLRKRLKRGWQIDRALEQ